MSEFKVGDKVRVLDLSTRTDKSRFIGKIGELVEGELDDFSSGDYGIKYTDHDLNEYRDTTLNTKIASHYLKLGEFELAKIKNTKLARKMYPNYTEDGDWLIINEK